MQTDVLKFIERIKSDSDLNGKVDEIKNLPGLVALGKELGFDFTEAELASEMKGDGEVSDEELDKIFGGSLGNSQSTGPSTCRCSWQD